MAKKMKIRKLSCEFCREGIRDIDYKDVERLSRYLTHRGKIISSRQTGVCAYHQRRLARAIKRARQMALLPYRKIYYL
ncbi:30S ribosomal protein S18 [Candidatus Pacearchaeota archaeon]|nr:MAG: 30S ribosomal protein S18 [Candidatus Pacearchaeota archaeon]